MALPPPPQISRIVCVRSCNAESLRLLRVRPHIKLTACNVASSRDCAPRLKLPSFANVDHHHLTAIDHRPGLFGGYHPHNSSGLVDPFAKGPSHLVTIQLGQTR